MMKFYQLSPQARLEQLKLDGTISDNDYNLLTSCINPKQLEICNTLSENVISGYVLPLSIVPNVEINSKIYSIPMVTEETSVVAAINHIAKLIKASGSITTNSSQNIGIGQIYLDNIRPNFTEQVNKLKQEWLDFANNGILSSMVKRGGGAKDLETKILPNNSAVINFHINTCDAMGANIINQTLEQITLVVERDLQTKTSIKILSNLTDLALTEATLKIKLSPEIALAICKASEFARLDPYRACTHNKGIMNGVDAVVIATGNDWRAVESAMHTFAKQKPLSTWKLEDDFLVGKLIAPINVGICGGITKVQPIVKTCLDILGPSSASELAGIIAAIGLMQNLAALLALSTKGICAGHMRLHIKNIIAELNPELEYIEQLTTKLTTAVSQGIAISTNMAKIELDKLKAST